MTSLALPEGQPFFPVIASPQLIHSKPKNHFWSGLQQASCSQMVTREQVHEALSKLLVSPLVEVLVISCTALLTSAVYRGITCDLASDNFAYERSVYVWGICVSRSVNAIWLNSILLLQRSIWWWFRWLRRCSGKQIMGCGYFGYSGLFSESYWSLLLPFGGMYSLAMVQTGARDMRCHDISHIRQQLLHQFSVIVYY